MESIVSTLLDNYRQLRFCPSDKFYWSPDTNEIFYDPDAPGPDGPWSLLHETGHALLGHDSYQSDFELVAMEVAAWERAKTLAEELGLAEIDENHVQDCLDTYRDWLYRRCICPDCGTKSLQQDPRHYRCFNCSARWSVTPSRFCRAYRSSKQAGSTLSSGLLRLPGAD